jgi:hypothetical protein
VNHEPPGNYRLIDGRHPRYDETYPKAAVSLFSGPSMHQAR